MLFNCGEVKIPKILITTKALKQSWLSSCHAYYPFPLMTTKTNDKLKNVQKVFALYIANRKTDLSNERFNGLMYPQERDCLQSGVLQAFLLDPR